MVIGMGSDKSDGDGGSDDDGEGNCTARMSIHHDMV